MATTPVPGSADESWRTYRYLADNAIDVVLEADLTTQIQWISPSVEEVLGWQPDELIGHRAPEIVHPDDMAEIGQMVQALNEHAARVRTSRVRMLRKDGSWKSLQLRGRPALDDAGATVGHIITLQDTTERDDALRALSVLSEGNRVLARVDSERDLLQQMCESIATTGDYPLTWYGALVDDADRAIAPRAIAGRSSAYLDGLQISWGDDPHGQGPTGTAARTGTTQVRHDFSDDPLFTPWLEAARAAGLRSSISLPVTVRGDIDGVLMVYASESHAFDQQAQSLLETLASDLGLGLERLRNVAALEEKTRESVEQTARLRGVFDSQFDPFVLLETVRDETGRPVDLRYVAASDAALAYNHLTRDEMIGHTLVELFPGQQADGTLDGYFSVIDGGPPIVLDDYEYFHEPRQETVRLDIRGVKSGDGIAITFRDVTARHEAAQALAESEERYRLLAENSSDVVWQAPAGGAITWASESARHVLGWEPAQLVGRSLDLVHPDDVEAVTEALSGLDRNLPAEGEARIQCADGSWRWMAFNSHRVTGREGAIDIVALRDIDAEVVARNALLHAIGHDPLTGMAARQAMIQRLSETLSRLAGRRLAAVLCVGVDRLSDINDAFTHSAGDLVLTNLAARIAEQVGNPDLVGRSAGVEFLVIIPDIGSGEEATGLAEQILAAAHRPVPLGDRSITPTVSIGIAIGDRRTDPEQLARDASVAMGQAKLEGRDRYAFADASLAEQARRRIDVEAGMREGLAEDRFLPYFQPVVDLSTGQLTGYEALVRFQRPDGTIAAPSRFMPIAELSPIVCDIDIVMLRRSLEALRHMPETVSVAVNLSTVTLTRAGYPQLIEQLIRETEVRPSRLHLEVTETALLGDTAKVVESMELIASMGARWYVDDFGTGYSSISHLRDLPISGLKLDVSFSEGIRQGDTKSIRLAQALAGLARGLGLDTVAEGIETEDEAATLLTQGWRHGQGWLYGRPGPIG